MAATNVLIFEKDIYGRRSDGRRYLIVPAGVPITDARARQLGIVPFKPSAQTKLPQPSEIKQPEPEPEPAEVETAVNATDDAIALAAEHGVDLVYVIGSGKGGRILKKDVRKLIE